MPKTDRWAGLPNLTYDHAHNNPFFVPCLENALLAIAEMKITRFLEAIRFKTCLKKVLLKRRWARYRLIDLIWLYRKRHRRLSRRELCKHIIYRLEYGMRMRNIGPENLKAGTMVFHGKKAFSDLPNIYLQKNNRENKLSD